MESRRLDQRETAPREYNHVERTLYTFDSRLQDQRVTAPGEYNHPERIQFM